MAVDWGAVDWWGFVGSLALIVPPLRHEVAKLQIFWQQRKADRQRQAAFKTLRQGLIHAMKATRDDWRLIDSACVVSGGAMLAWSFLRRGLA